MTLLLLFNGTGGGTSSNTVVGRTLRHTRRELESRLKIQRDETFSRRRWEEMLAEAREAVRQAKTRKRVAVIAEKASSIIETISSEPVAPLKVMRLIEALDGASQAKKLSDTLAEMRKIESAIKAISEALEEEFVTLFLL